MEQENFKDTKVNFNKLIEFGFDEANGRYTYSAPVGENQFLLKIVVDQNGKLSTEMLDKSSGDEYVLHLVEGATVSFVAKHLDKLFELYFGNRLVINGKRLHSTTHTKKYM